MSEAIVVCSVCGKPHPREKIELTFRRPDIIAAIPKKTRSQRCKESDDLCALWGSGSELDRFFVRGVLPLPVDGRDTPYRIGAWAEVDKDAFSRIIDLWKEPSQTEEPAFPGVLANAIPIHKSALGLNVQLQLTGPTTRPNIMVLDTSHALYQEQIRGVSEHRVHEYTSLVT